MGPNERKAVAIIGKSRLTNFSECLEIGTRKESLGGRWFGFSVTFSSLALKRVSYRKEMQET